VVLALGGAAVVAATGGGGGEPAVSAGFLARAAAATQEAESSRIAIAMAIEAAGQSFEISGDGVMRTNDGQPQMTMRLTMGPLGSMEERLLGQVLYLRVQSADPSAALAGGKWLRLDLAEVASAQPEMRALVEQLKGNAGSADPTSALESLRALSDDITEVGEEQVRAGTATRYDGTLDTRRLAARASERLGAGAASSLDAVLAAMGEVPTSIWIDGEGRLVKYQMRLDLGALAGAATGTERPGSMRMSFEFFDFGTDARVETPPADQTVDGFDLLMRAKTS
jgi:hypothetical protein